MFTNKHVIVAMLVAPLLAVLAWFTVGGFLAEKPGAARPGASYPLLAKSSCRWASGVCELSNNDVLLSMHLDDAVGPVMELEASHALDSVLMSVGDPAVERGPRAMQPLDSDGRRWSLPLGSRPGDDDSVRLVVSLSGSAYFAEVPTDFTRTEADEAGRGDQSR